MAVPDGRVDAGGGMCGGRSPRARLWGETVAAVEAVTLSTDGA